MLNLRRTSSALVLASFLGLGSSGCTFLTETIHGTGPKVSEVREVSAFQRVAIAGSFEVDVVAGESGGFQEVRLDCHENLMEYIETDVRGQTLRVRVREGYRVTPRPQVAIRIGELSGIEIAGSADVEATGLTGAGFSVEIAGSGNVRAQGEVDGVEVEIAGSGEVQLANLRAREARVRIAGSGDVDLHAEDLLDVSIAGSGDVTYTGSPEVHQSVAGSGDIVPRD